MVVFIVLTLRSTVLTVFPQTFLSVTGDVLEKLRILSANRGKQPERAKGAALGLWERRCTCPRARDGHSFGNWTSLAASERLLLIRV